MSVLGWMTLGGGLLLFMALASSVLKRLPISTACIYLGVGLLLGPLGVDLIPLDVVADREWLETLTEFAVIVSLFVGGLRLRLPLRHPTWRRAAMLAGPVMLFSIAGIAGVSHLLFGLSLFPALLLGALIAPTDPVLAAEVSVNDSQDHDRVRLALSGEAGLNDGAAFPFVIFGLEGLRYGAFGEWTFAWLGWRLLWAVPAGLAIGYAMGLGVGRLAIALRHRQRESGAPNDFLALALIALAYAAAEGVHAWGFLSVFAAGVGLRNAEVHVVVTAPHPEVDRHHAAPRNAAAGEAVSHPPAETLIPANVADGALAQPAVAAGVLISDALTFGHTLERLLEMMLVVLVGVALAHSWWAPAGLLAGILLLIIRPLGTTVLVRLNGISVGQRRLLGWFGIRGIGSLYYLTYALNHGVEGPLAERFAQIVVTVVACSIVVHGITVTPVLSRYERAIARGLHRPG